MKTAVGAPAPRPTIEEILEGLSRLTVVEILEVGKRIWGIESVEHLEHGAGCNCWECDGRGPDAKNDYNNTGYGSCAYCSEALGRDDPYPVHTTCGPAFYQYLVGS